MGATKGLFEIMQLESVANMELFYEPTFTKKEAIKQGTELTKKVFDDGNIDPLVFGSNMARLNEVINAAVTEFRNKIIDIEKCTVNGVEFNPVNGGETLNFEDDEVYFTLKSDLKSREEMLKLAYKSKDEFFDAYGNPVPKVSSKPRKSSITIKF